MNWTTLWALIKYLPMLIKLLPTIMKVIDEVMCAVKGDCEKESTGAILSPNPAPIAKVLIKQKKAEIHEAIAHSRKGNLLPLIQLIQLYKGKKK